MNGQLTVGSLFSGIGGLELGLERTGGFRTVWQCEIDPYCRAVLRKHWPDTHCYEDIRDIDGETERVDVICGGFPCQPVSLAGKGLAQEDPRWLWPEFARVVGLLRPRYIIVENVPGLVGRGLGDVVAVLAEMGYDAEWQIVSAASVGAPHLRERLFIIAYPHRDSQRFAERSEPDGKASQPEQQAPFGNDVGGLRSSLADAAGGRFSRPLLDWLETSQRYVADSRWWLSEPDVGRVAHGIPGRVDRLRGLGNAVVPQVAQFVGELILAA